VRAAAERKAKAYAAGEAREAALAQVALAL
jgi:hypothetical protein